MAEVTDLIGPPTDTNHYVTGKAFIPYYFGDDTTRTECHYKGIGRVIFSGTDVTDYPMYKRARLGMGYLPQEESIFRKMTVEQNIMAILETLSLSKAERKNRCEQLLHQFLLNGEEQVLAGNLSHGK